MPHYTPRRRHRQVAAMMEPAPGDDSASPRGSNPNFQDVARLKNSSGILAIISQRKDGTLSAGFFREWTTYDHKTGAETTARGSFIPQHLMRSYAEMVAMATERMEQLESAGELPFPRKQ